MAMDNTCPPTELDRCEIDDQTVQSLYQSGYSYYKVTSIFGTGQSYPDLLSRIIQIKLNAVNHL